MSYLPVKIVFFLNIRLLFNIFCCFCMFVKNISYISSAYISKTKHCNNGKPSAYCFYVKTKMLVDFHIYISVPLMENFIFCAVVAVK